ncbi:MAG: fimbrillin family protein [Tannerellaceae bacterium]|nr:fimbrillin family protein [Tannerellaceae bacterium]
MTPPTSPSQQKDIGVASALERTQSKGAVPLTFNHAMHKVKFSARYTPGLFVDNTGGLGDGGYIKVTTSFRLPMEI